MDGADLISAPSGPLPVSLGPQRLTIEPAPQYPVAVISATNRCNLSCAHCFVFRDGNPNDPRGEMKPEVLLAEVRRLRDRHGIVSAFWMGGEPMIRWRMLAEAVKLFPLNTITTNGTIPLRDFGPDVTYVVSLDGPRDVNDLVRGAGVYDEVMKTIAAIAEGFQSQVVVQCVVHRANQHRLAELVEALRPTKVNGVVFTFYVPSLGEVSPRAWPTLEDRENAIDVVLELKARHPGFIRNSVRALELMRPATAKLVTDHCPLLKFAIPLYLEGERFTAPFCCYGNDVDCDRCGSWGVFFGASKMDGPWDDLLPRPADEPTSRGEMTRAAALAALARQDTGAAAARPGRPTLPPEPRR